MFSRKNCVYSFFCCSFSESLCTKELKSSRFFVLVPEIPSSAQITANSSLEASHSGSFAKILNTDGIQALAAKYGVTNFPIDNSNCVYTSQFNTSHSGGGINVGGSSSANQQTTPSTSQSGGSIKATTLEQRIFDFDGDGYLTGDEYMAYKSMEGVHQDSWDDGVNIG